MGKWRFHHENTKNIYVYAIYGTIGQFNIPN